MRQASLGLLLCISGTLFAEDEPGLLELLEFIGEWEHLDGEWIDPLAMEGMPAEASTTQEPASEAADQEVHDDTP